MGDENTQVGTPAPEGAQPLGGESTGAPTSKTEGTPTPQYLTREDLEGVLGQWQGQFATRSELKETTERAAQVASDRRFETLMRKLAPELRGIDSAVKLGRMTQEDARALKAEMIADATSQMPDESQPATPSQPQPMQPQETPQERVEAAMSAAGVTWAELGFKAGGTVSEKAVVARIAEVAAQKKAAALLEGEKAKWQKEYEAKAKTNDEAVKAAAGGTPGGAPPQTINPKTLLKQPANLAEAYKKKYPHAK